jgi:hypothetical protein|tara:strand:+ start:50 stop:232 length:183 start_codon:yes stop_codon:yes gene_type:complete
MKKIKPIKRLDILPDSNEDIIRDINIIREKLTENTGMSISGANAVRSCIKAWFELNSTIN